MYRHIDFQQETGKPLAKLSDTNFQGFHKTALCTSVYTGVPLYLSALNGFLIHRSGRKGKWVTPSQRHTSIEMELLRIARALVILRKHDCEALTINDSPKGLLSGVNDHVDQCRKIVIAGRLYRPELEKGHPQYIVKPAAIVLPRASLRNVFQDLLQMVCDNRWQSNSGFLRLFGYIYEDAVINCVFSRVTGNDVLVIHAVRPRF